MQSNILIGFCAGLLALVAAPIAAPAQNAPAAPAPAAPVPVMEPKAIEVLKAASDKLAAANTLEFTAVSTYERAARNGQPLYYSLVHQVTVQRPDKMRVITPGDGTPDEFYYDGKTMMAYVPSSDLVAVADAPPTIDKLIVRRGTRMRSVSPSPTSSPPTPMRNCRRRSSRLSTSA